MFPDLGPVVWWNKQWISEVHKKHYDLQKKQAAFVPWVFVWFIWVVD